MILLSEATLEKVYGICGSYKRPCGGLIRWLLWLYCSSCSACFPPSRMIVDIFPAIDIPVVVVVWNYPGLSPEDMERRVVLISERAYSTTVNGIQRIESQSIPGVGMLKVYFQPGSDIGAAIAQISSVSFTILRIAPPGMQPPTIVQFSATNVPVAQLTVSSKTIPGAEALRLRAQLHPRPAVHHSRAFDARALRREEPPDHDRREPRRARRARAFRRRRGQRAPVLQFDHPRGNGPHRRHGIQRAR